MLSLLTDYLSIFFFFSSQKDMELFSRVATHPKFTKDPINAISDHVKYLIQMENGES